MTLMNFMKRRSSARLLFVSRLIDSAVMLAMEKTEAISNIILNIVSIYVD